MQFASLDSGEIEYVVDNAQKGEAEDWILSTYPCRRSRPLCCARWEKPTMAFIGVRISWLMLARK